jgi:hypothetical protein
VTEPDAHTDTLWRFVRGDMPPAAFEQWTCTTPALESELGAPLYLQAISASYRDPYQIDSVKKAVESFLRTCRPAPCACLEMRDLQVVPMGEHERRLKTAEAVERHGEPLWWLEIDRCSACGQWWLLAAEERQNDNYCLRRMTDVEAERVLAGGPWPTDFHQYETLVRLGIDAGHVFRFLHPMDTRWTIALLARQRPGIRVSEIAKLVALDQETAAVVAREVVRLEGVDVTFDVGTAGSA